jgi:hypothetical protein
MYSPNVTSMRNCFRGRSSDNRLNIYAYNNSNTLTNLLYTNSYSIIGSNITWTEDVDNKYYYNTSINTYIYPKTTVGINFNPPEGCYILYNQTKSMTVDYEVMEGWSATFDISSSSSNLTVSNIVQNSDTVTFDITGGTFDSVETVTINMASTDGEFEKSKPITFKVVEEEPVDSYNVESVEGATYGFTLNDNGYYESTNKGKDNTYSICKVNIVSSGTLNMYVDCINYGENKYDYGILSTLDNGLNKNNSADTANVFKTFKTESSASVKTIDYGIVPAGEHSIYIKYIKDSSGSNNNDSLQFKIRFE